MEKFEIDGGKSLEIFNTFVVKAKGVFTALIENIKANIKDYEVKIEDTAKEISDNEISREKCEQEITKMEDKIAGIKDAIENVESTYKKIVDAYSSTSKGDTKELYSEIIENAKTNCDKDVEKNRSEIAKLNSDIEAIKNNILEFSKIIDELNADLENYNTELYRYTKALEYFENVSEDASAHLEEVATKKEDAPKSKTTKKSDTKKTSKSKTVEATPKESEEKPSVLASFETESFETEKDEEQASENKNINELSFEESLKQIYDLTGYKTTQEEPKAEEVVEEPPVVQDKPVYTDNLENLFSTPSADVETPKEERNDMTSFLDAEFSNWENILNADYQKEEEPVLNNEEKAIDSGLIDTVNQLLNPYGTTFDRLKSLVADNIVYKNGEKIPFVLSADDLIKVINSVDGNDLKKMKTVGPEITLLRKVKEMKEGNR